jgi:hypothetical protein
MKKFFFLVIASLAVKSAAFAAITQDIVCKSREGYTLVAKLQVTTPEKDLANESPLGVVTLRDKGGKVIVKERIKVTLESTLDGTADILSQTVEDLNSYDYMLAGLSIPLSVYGRENSKFRGRINYASNPYEGNPATAVDEDAVCVSKVLK